MTVYGYRAASTIARDDVARLRDYPAGEPLAGLWTEASGDRPFLSRPGGRHLSKLLERGDHLVVASIGQLAVRRSDLIALAKWLIRKQVTLHLADDGFVAVPGTATFPNVAGPMNEAHRQWRSDCIKAALARKKQRDGVYCRPAYGYRIVEQNGERRFEVCSSEQRWIDEAVAMHRAGKSYVEIAEDFRQRRATTAQGTAWSYWRVRRAVRKRVAEEAAQVGTRGREGTAAPEPSETLCQEAPPLSPEQIKALDNGPIELVIEGVRVFVFQRPAKSEAQGTAEAKAMLAVLRAMLGRPLRTRTPRRQHTSRHW